MSRYEDVYALSGWTGCGSQHEHDWHFATTESNAWPWRSFASHFTYKPGPGCSSLRRFNQRELVQNLVERGGWLLIGDSLTEGHFFSISCMLHPHVRATPDYVVGTDYDRGWPQNLYLLPNSSFARSLRFPPGFSFEHTPLVTYRRVDVIMAPEELLPLYARVAPDKTKSANPEIRELYGNIEEVVFNAHSAEVLALFTSPPPLNYGALILSSGAHWTDTVFGALESPSEIISFFGATVAHWVTRVAEALAPVSRPSWATSVSWSGFTSSGKPRQVVVRAANWGSEDCLSDKVRWGGPTPHIPPLTKPFWNWGWIPLLNEAAQRAVSEAQHPQIHYLPIERPAMLRPDAHVLPDCLHIATGTGAMETWTEYIAHFLWAEHL
ncbi:hypothetical protein EXIGLDRAFT_614623 [Exidia glandulosa HHB12029]|uniref:Uncharacterized protein n=1 Tax=Exidia glandulosa HHB12029 TaxID=1314781 RepID=A0A165HP70_EXIGL|nr:hypothetical protein EXIGLDRAFT_614623 [Exidia glandulosa HHB12029]